MGRSGISRNEVFEEGLAGLAPKVLSAGACSMLLEGRRPEGAPAAEEDTAGWCWHLRGLCRAGDRGGDCGEKLEAGARAVCCCQSSSSGREEQERSPPPLPSAHPFPTTASQNPKEQAGERMREMWEMWLSPNTPRSGEGWAWCGQQ